MTTSGRWRSLDLARSGAPKLLLKSHFTSTSYDVQLTDLCRIWTESLTKRDIIRRAWDDGSSIDPSEDDQQFKIFVEKIEGALNGEDGTTMDMLPSEDDGILLKLSAPLPKPFRTLVWTISLTRQPEEALAGALTVPLLHQAVTLQLQMQQLIHELHDKDRVISKITDRLETSGNDLTTVFPGVSNIKTTKKKTQREQLARHVKGLADFDEAGWRSRGNSGEGNDLWERVDGVLRGLPEPQGIDGDQPTEKKWWRGLATKAEALSEGDPSPQGSKTPSNAGTGTPAALDESMVDEEFQRQGTPVHLKRNTSPSPDDGARNDEADVDSGLKRGQKAVEVDDGDSTTEDEDDLDAVPKKKDTPSVDRQQSPAMSAGPSSGPSKQLGAIGGRSTKHASSPARTSPPEQQLQPPKSRGKLGAIGGGGRTKNSESPAPVSVDDQAPPPSSAPRKMGIIGGKRKPPNPVPSAATSPNATPSPEPVNRRSRAPTKEATPPPRETSQERADRKRDQLKKELEQKAKAPAKKKRKF